MDYKPSYRYIPPINWHALTPLYDLFCKISGLGKRLKKKVLNSFDLKDGSTVADIGCGTGVFLKIAKEKYPKVKFFGIDPDQNALDIAKSRFNKSKLHIKIDKGFAESLPFADKSIDVCFSTLAFHHMPDKVKYKAIKEIYRVLKPGGTVIIADFGESKSRIFKLISVFENIEYIEGNLKGLVNKYLAKAKFKNLKVVGKHWPEVKIIQGQK